MGIKEDLMQEASRCIQCRHQPCVQACPAHNHIPELMSMIKVGAFSDARALWRKTSTLGEICGVLCPHETLCEGHCTLEKIHKPIKIGWVEEQLAIMFPDDIYPSKDHFDHRHLVIGLGPAGIANAIKMAEYGFKVECLEKETSLGGAILTHVPDFRYEHERLQHYQQRFDRLGIQVRYGTEVGKDVDLDDLVETYDTIFIAPGLDLPSKVDILNEDQLPIHYAIDLLNKNRFTVDDLAKKLGHVVGIIGLGNVSVDLSRRLIRAGKEVHIIYRRTLAESPASRREIMEAVHEGVAIHELFGPIAFRRKETKRMLDCQRTCVIRDAETGRNRVEALEGENVAFELDDLVFATGQISSGEVFDGSSIKLFRGEKDYLTSYPHVFVGGDFVNKEKRIVDAMVSGQTVATLIRNRIV